MGTRGLVSLGAGVLLSYVSSVSAQSVAADPLSLPEVRIGAATPRASSASLALRSDSADHPGILVSGTSCAAPCTLQLPIGLQVAVATGDPPLYTHFNLPPEGGSLVVRQGDPTMMYAGAVLTPLGIVMASLLWMSAFSCPPYSTYGGSSECTTGHLTAWPVLGAVTTVVGGTLLGLGLPRARAQLAFEP